MTSVQYVLVSCRLHGGLFVLINSTRWLFRSLGSGGHVYIQERLSAQYF
jgi:hypothetical protein